MGCYTGKLYDSSVDVHSIKECCEVLRFKGSILEDAPRIIRKRAKLKEGCEGCTGCEESRRGTKYENFTIDELIEEDPIELFRRVFGDYMQKITDEVINNWPEGGYPVTKVEERDGGIAFTVDTTSK